MAQAVPTSEGATGGLPTRASGTAGQASSGTRRAMTTEPAPVRWLLIAVALAFLTLFLLLPLVAVFVQAFAKGAAAYFGALRDPDAAQRRPPDAADGRRLRAAGNRLRRGRGVDDHEVQLPRARTSSSR